MRLQEMTSREDLCRSDLSAVLKDTRLVLELEIIDDQIAQRNQQIQRHKRKQK